MTLTLTMLYLILHASDTLILQSESINTLKLQSNSHSWLKPRDIDLKIVRKFCEAAGSILAVIRCRSRCFIWLVAFTKKVQYHSQPSILFEICVKTPNCTNTQAYMHCFSFLYLEHSTTSRLALIWSTHVPLSLFCSMSSLRGPTETVRMSAGMLLKQYNAVILL